VAVQAALELTRRLASADLPFRVGVHTGQIEQRHDGDVSGLALNIAVRLETIARCGEVLVSRTVQDLLMGSPLSFDPRGGHQLKGVEGTWELFAAC
jgi:class 3 adenylate cyclase